MMWAVSIRWTMTAWPALSLHRDQKSVRVKGEVKVEVEHEVEVGFVEGGSKGRGIAYI